MDNFYIVYKQIKYIAKQNTIEWFIFNVSSNLTFYHKTIYPKYFSIYYNFNVGFKKITNSISYLYLTIYNMKCNKSLTNSFGNKSLPKYFVKTYLWIML